MASSSQHESEYGSGSHSRDTLAETFVTAFFSAQGEIAKTVQKGLSAYFELDSDMRRHQHTADILLTELRKTVNPSTRTRLTLTLNTLLDAMCTAQRRINQQWTLLDEEMTSTVSETEGHWKKAEPFFRTKQKRALDSGGVTTGRTTATAQPDLRGKARKILPVVPMKLTPLGGDIVRPSLIPKKILVKSNGKVGETKRRWPSDSPDPQEPVRSRPPTMTNTTTTSDRKKTSAATLKRAEKRQEKERKQQKSLKKKRVIRTHVAQRKPKREETDESASEDSGEESDPPYRGPSDGAVGNGSHGGDKQRFRNDPDEPRYCVCKNVSYGHMVGCDNDECVIEWFHFVCVGLKAKPRGKWFCPTCRDGENSKVMRSQQGEGGKDAVSDQSVTKSV